MSARTAEEWEILLNAHGIPAGRILTIPEVLAHPQIAARDLVQSLPMQEGVAVAGAQLESVKVVRAGFDLADTQPTARCAPPTLGQHNDLIYGQLGRDAAELARLKADGAI